LFPVTGNKRFFWGFIYLKFTNCRYVFASDPEVRRFPLHVITSVTVEFGFVEESVGDHTVEVDGESGSFTVERKGIPGFPLESLSVGLALVLWTLIAQNQC